MAGRETDDLEQWLDREIEAPAEEAFRKATADVRMSSEDWSRLLRFVVALDVRTPAWFWENSRIWEQKGPEWIEQALRESVSKLEEAAASGPTPSLGYAAIAAEKIPIQIKTVLKPDQETARIEAKMLVGRGLWTWAIRRLLGSSWRVVLRHRWTILHPPAGSAWFTTDNPVLRLNRYPTGHYDFLGGWGSAGTELIVPLDPNHLLYTRVGSRPQRRGDCMPKSQANLVRRFIAEHAHRFIFASEPDPEVPCLRPRAVDRDRFLRERIAWDMWNERQSAAEMELTLRAAPDSDATGHTDQGDGRQHS